MTKKEIKSYIDRILGNNLRVLLPSHWWKKAFGAVIDDMVTYDTLKTVGGQSIIGTGNVEIGLKNVASKEELEKLKAKNGDIATMVAGNSKEETLSNSLRQVKRVSGLNINDVPYSAPVNEASIWLYGLKDGVLKIIVIDTIGDGHTVILYIDNLVELVYDALLITGGEINEEELIRLNSVLRDDVYYCLTIGHGLSYPEYDAIDFYEKYFSFNVGDPIVSDAYIKAEDWEKFAKEHVVKNRNYLDGLNVPAGAIAKTLDCKDELYSIKGCHFYEDGDTFEALTPVTKIALEFPAEPPTDVALIYFARKGSYDFLRYRLEFAPHAGTIIWYGHDYTLEISGNVIDQRIVDLINKELSSTDWRIVDCLIDSNRVSGIEAADVIDTWFKMVKEQPHPNAYVKGKEWQKLAKEHVVASEEELDSLNVPAGTIAKVAVEGQSPRLTDFYQMTSEEMESMESMIAAIDKCERIYSLDFSVPTFTKPAGGAFGILFKKGTEEMLLLMAYPTGGLGVVHRIGFDGVDYEIAASYAIIKDGETTIDQEAVREVNRLLQEGDYRFTSEAQDTAALDNCIHPNIIVSKANAYIKDENWTRLAKEGEAVRKVHVSFDDTPLTDEQKAENAKTYRIAKENGNVALTLEGSVIMWYVDENGDISAHLQEKVGIDTIMLYFYLHEDGSITIDLYDMLQDYIIVQSPDGLKNFLHMVLSYGYMPRVALYGDGNGIMFASGYSVKDNEVTFYGESTLGLIGYVYSTEDYSFIRIERVENDYTQRISELERKVAELEAKLS